ncbi:MULTISPECIES: hypothetical protein [Acidovorax]|uniref:Uncharacterized protein n=1 Tax=Acidovorax facilis TaxID=12917 RepID=A0ABV8DAW8_9BURK|nr:MULTISPECIES: hypothetical protein [Acidovorax]MBO1010494.1 hypothetical protein [Acidovorax sp. SD340]MCO4244410.1 hypothetical protein [Acidovorax facilis]
MTISNIARSYLLGPLCMIAVVWMGEAMAGTSECYAIKDADKRAYCLAQVKRDAGICYRIKDGDKRNQCLADIKGSRDRCYTIKEHDARKTCLALK